jgi:uncharacterized protein DUF1573
MSVVHSKASRLLFACAVIISSSGGQLILSSPASGQAPPAEQALRKRVEEFYAFWQSQNWPRAEEYVTEKTKQTFLDEKKGTFVRYEIDVLDLSPDQQSAKVTVKLYILSPMTPRPFPFPKTSEWQQVNGVWFCDWAAAGGVEDQGVAHTGPEELKFKGHRYWFGQIKPDQIKTARYPFTNVTNHEVKLASVLTSCKCLQVKTEKKFYKPGESGELAIEFNPAGYERDYIQTIVVKTDPGDLITHLMIGAFVIPPPREPSTAPPASPRPALKPPSHPGSGNPNSH